MSHILNTKSTDIGKIAEALMKFQSEMPPIPTNETNTLFKNKYSSFEDIVSTSLPHLKNNGLSISQMPLSFFDEGKYFVGIETILLHTSGQWLSSVLYFPVEYVSPPDKKVSPVFVFQNGTTAIGFARRNGWLSILGLVNDDKVVLDSENGSQSSNGDSNISSLRNAIETRFNSNTDLQEKYKKLYEKHGEPNKIMTTEKLQVLLQEMKETK